MGQKINPFSYRLGIIRDWSSRWFSHKKDFKKLLEEDMVIRRAIIDKVSQAGIIKIDIERGAHGAYRVFVKAARPGLIIGRGGKGVEDLTKQIESSLKKLLNSRPGTKSKLSLSLNIEELKKSEVAAQYAAQSIAWDLERRLPARRVMKKSLEQIMQNRDVKGAKVRLSGRIDGNEISRREWVAKGSMPLTTLRADIDYGEARSYCTYGNVGVKVWIYKGEVFNKKA